MSQIGIVGAGHSGLQLGFALLRDGDEVTLYSDKRPGEFATTRLPSSNGVFSRGLDRERDLGINFWEGDEPLIDQTLVSVCDPTGSPVIRFDGRFARHGQAVDQRIKFDLWLREFERRGGRVVYGAVGPDDLESIAAAHDLAVVAAGKGDVTRQFATDESRMTFQSPQRRILMLGVRDVVHHSPDGVAYNILPGVGEAFGIPMRFADGPGIAWVIEAVPGGPMDRHADLATADDALNAGMAVFRDFFPWELERHRDARLADQQAWLTGSITPTVRKPVLTLPSGRVLMGMADVVVLNDPCTGQGANSASEAAAVVHRSIRARRGRAFDASWMQDTFEEFWEYAQWPTAFTNALLSDWPPHAIELLQAANDLPEIGHRFAMSFNDPRDLPDYFFDQERCRTYIRTARERRAVRDEFERQFASAA